MNTSMKQVLFWTPRVLGSLFAAFLSLFALDVFGEGYGFPEIILALVVHLLPALVVLTAVLIAWRWEAVGGFLLIVLGAWYLRDWPRWDWSRHGSRPARLNSFYPRGLKQIGRGMDGRAPHLPTGEKKGEENSAAHEAHLLRQEAGQGVRRARSPN